MYYLVLVKGTCSGINNESTVDVYAIPGYAVDLKCPLNSLENETFWTRDNVIISRGRDFNKNTTRLKILEYECHLDLQISSVMKTDEDKYCCEYIFKKKPTIFCSKLHVKG